MFKKIFKVSKSTLQQAVDRAPSLGVLDLDGLDLLLTEEPLTISRPLQIVSHSNRRLGMPITISGCEVEFVGTRHLNTLVVEGGGKLNLRNTLMGPLKAGAGAIVIATGADTQVMVRASRFFGLRSGGVVCQSGAVGVLADCAFDSIDTPAISLKNVGTRCEVTNCRFEALRGMAILVEDDAQVRIADSTFESIESPAVYIDGPKSIGLLTNCFFKSLRSNGVHVSRGAKVTISVCGFEALAAAAVLLKNAHTFCTLIACTFTDLRSTGVHALGGAQAKIDDCRIGCNSASTSFAAIFAGGPYNCAQASVSVTHRYSQLQIQQCCNDRRCTAWRTGIFLQLRIWLALQLHC